VFHVEQITRNETLTREYSRKAFARACRLNGLLLSREQLALLESYVDLLVDWNSRINLISRSDIGNVWFRHILHSLSILLVVALPQNLKVLDLGSGGGLPGLPIAIVRKDLKVILLDSIKKKVTALKDMVSTLELSNVAVIAGRAEDIMYQGHNSFDLVVARAVGRLDDLVEWSSRLARKKPSLPKVLHTKDFRFSSKQSFRLPCLLALKGGDIEHEIRIVRKRKGRHRIVSLDIALEESYKNEMEDKKIVVVEL
jgi:16S rRNA (guanine527-N7)-methyltransferase